MSKPVVSIGDRYGEWEVLSRADNTKQGKCQYVCRCSCGKNVVVVSGNLRSGGSKNCGHDRGERFAALITKHGAKAGGEKNPLYDTWNAMMGRCFNPLHNEYKNYGGRGITVCERWRDFNLFAKDMPDRPSTTHSIDRFPDNDGNYEPGNVRWATKREQNINRRTTVWIEFNGVRLCATEWAERLGMNAQTITNRLKAGVSVERALNPKGMPRGRYS